MRIGPQREAGASSSTDGEDKSRHTSTKTENNNQVFLCLFGEGEGGCVAGVARRHIYCHGDDIVFWLKGGYRMYGGKQEVLS